MIAHTIATRTHGRYLVVPPADGAASHLLVGFHGYAEPASAAMERLQTIPGAGEWRLVAIQGLHRFYRGRSRDVVASWMTREDRDLAIADNDRYVAAVIDAVAGMALKSGWSLPRSRKARRWPTARHARRRERCPA